MNYLLNTSLDPYFNMAFDSYVLENTDFEGVYLWQNSPAVIVGLNQSIYAEVNLQYLREHGISPVRRVSGGGAVYHDLGNVNYTFVGSGAAVEKGPSLIASALKGMGVPAELSGRNDILVDGRKCSGYAKRLATRTREGDCSRRVMVHGTLLFSVDLEALTRSLAVPGSKLSAAGVESVRSRVANLSSFLPYLTVQEFIDALRAALQADSPSVTLSAAQTSEIEKIAQKQFRSWEWIYGHSPSADFQSSRKFYCGTISVCYSLRHGRFTSVSFQGDFIGERPASELTALMTGLRPEDLFSLPIGDYFDGLTAAEFITLFA